MYDSGKPEANKNNVPITIQGFRLKENHVCAIWTQTPCLVKEIIIVLCRTCDTSFGICRSCWRGQAYCTPECRKLRQEQKHREAQHRYRQTEKGKATHRKWERKNRRIHDPVDKSPMKAGSNPSGKRAESNGTTSKNNSQPKKTMAETSSRRRGDGLKVVGSIVRPPVICEAKASEKWATCRFCGQKGVVVGRFQ
jgi:hypothetical protein